MSNLRNSNLRKRDIRKLIDLKAPHLKWEEGSTEKNEWVYISEEKPKFQEKLNAWLASKRISSENECLTFDDSFSESSKITWKEVMNENLKYIEGKNISVYDIDLKWVLQLTTLGVARFGRYKSSEKT